MPPSPFYNWLCVLHSTSEILSHVARIRAARVAQVNAEAGIGLKDAARRTHPSGSPTARSVPPEHERKGNDVGKSIDENVNGRTASGKILTSSATFEGGHVPESVKQEALSAAEPPLPARAERSTVQQFLDNASVHTTRDIAHVLSASKVTSEIRMAEPSSQLGPGIPEEKPVESDIFLQQQIPLSQAQRNLQASRVPSSRIGRLFHYGGLAASLSYGVASEALRRVSSSERGVGQSSLVMTPANIKRLVEKLSKMRGAALKLGQFMSIQDTHLLPKDVEEIFRRVQDSAHYMPNWQMERVMADALGPNWELNFASFDRVPFAAASLGQVHSAVLAAHASPTGKEEKVAIKVQFPDIEKSIESDVGYLKLLLNASKLLPRGLFLDKTLQVMKGELAEECDYTREAASARFFGSESGLGKDERFKVPWVWEGSMRTVLVMQHMEGVSVGGNVVDDLSQESRDQIASSILELCMRELFDFRMMQTDPNWSNFLWNERTRQIELVDFGATRTYSKEFIDKWMSILKAGVAEDREACIHWSLELGYLTGKESKTMLDAHVRSLTLLTEPFRTPKNSSDGRYAFGRETEWARNTAEVRSLIPVMLSERLTPPPRETYSLNRKLSGAFLLASRLGARVTCKAIWDATVDRYQVGPILS